MFLQLSRWQIVFYPSYSNYIKCYGPVLQCYSIKCPPISFFNVNFHRLPLKSVLHCHYEFSMVKKKMAALRFSRIGINCIVKPRPSLSPAEAICDQRRLHKTSLKDIQQVYTPSMCAPSCVCVKWSDIDWARALCRHWNFTRYRNLLAPPLQHLCHRWITLFHVQLFFLAPASRPLWPSKYLSSKKIKIKKAPRLRINEDHDGIVNKEFNDTDALRNKLKSRWILVSSLSLYLKIK